MIKDFIVHPYIERLKALVNIIAHSKKFYMLIPIIRNIEVYDNIGNSYKIFQTIKQFFFTTFTHFS